MKVGICLVFYDDKQHLSRNLESINSLEYRNFVIFYTDNNPEKLHHEWLKSRIPDAIYVESNENSGFAKGNNLLARQAKANGCDLIWIINPDMAPRSSCLSELVNCLNNNPNTEAAGPVLLYGDTGRQQMIQFAGGEIDFITQAKSLQFVNKNEKELPSENSRKVDLVNGGSMIIRARWLNNNELFDENYFMYNDEMDLMKRIRNRQKDVRIVFNAICVHHHDWSKSNKKSYHLMYYYMMRNKILYWKKYKYKKAIIWSLFEYIIRFPVILRFCLRTSGVRLLYYYYLGLLHGYLGKKGKSDIFSRTA